MFAEKSASSIKTSWLPKQWSPGGSMLHCIPLCKQFQLKMGKQLPTTTCHLAGEYTFFPSNLCLVALTGL